MVFKRTGKEKYTLYRVEKNYRRKDGEENQQQSETSVSLSFKQFKPKLRLFSVSKIWRDFTPDFSYYQ